MNIQKLYRDYCKEADRNGKMRAGKQEFIKIMNEKMEIETLDVGLFIDKEKERIENGDCKLMEERKNWIDDNMTYTGLTSDRLPFSVAYGRYIEDKKTRISAKRFSSDAEEKIGRCMRVKVNGKITSCYVGWKLKEKEKAD